MKKMKKVLWGLCFILIGVILGLNVLGIMDINIFFDGWWTIFIIVPCFIGLYEGEIVGNLIGLIIGLALLCGAQGWISFGTIMKLIVPVSLVIIGITILMREVLGSKIEEGMKKINTEDLETITAVFGGQKISPDKEFLGSDIEAVFGSVELDIRDATLKKETAIKVSAIFGGVSILLPNDVNVKVKSTPIFGGVDNKARTKDENKKTIYIEAIAVFGGVEIK